MGTAPAVLNMANDYCVYKFLNEEIKFTDIPIIIESAMNNHQWTERPNLECLRELDLWTKNFVDNFQ
jgi:1-deoxy-D-xylulose-5-phosphate reductoisomerase